MPLVAYKGHALVWTLAPTSSTQQQGNTLADRAHNLVSVSCRYHLHMESTMDLPPPAPPDAFSLDDEDSSVPSTARPQQQTATASATAAGLSSSIHASQRVQNQQQHGIATNLDNSAATAAQQASSTSPPAVSAATDSMHLGHSMAGATDVPTDQQTQQQSHAGIKDAQTQQQQDSPTKQSTSPKGTSPRQPATQAPAGDTKDGDAPQEQQQQQQHVPGHRAGHRQQPKDLTGLLSQLSDNAEAIAAAEEVLGGLLARQAALHQLGRKMEQQQVLSVLEQGQLGYNKGRPVAAVLLYRCLHRWGLLQQTEPCPFLEQLASLLQSQLDLDDASAPAEVAGLQCHVANSLTLCAVLYCVLLKASHPELAAAAAAAGEKAPKQLHSAADVMAAARKKMSATWQQGVAHMGPGLQALGKLKLGSWGFKRSEDAAATPAAAAHDAKSSTSTSSPGHPAAADQSESLQTSTDATQDTSAAAAAGSRQSATSPSPSSTSAGAGPAGTTAAAVTAESLHAAAPLGAFMLCLDHLVQHAYILLRDQLKRRLTPLLADCISPENNTLSIGESAMSDDTGTAAAAAAGGGEGGGQTGQPLSPSAAGAAVAGSAAESAAHAEAALMNFRSWSELVGVLHAALVALRAAHVPRALRAALMQQVLEFVNCQLFNQLLLRPECCSVSNARYALRGLKQLDTWIIAEQSAAQHDTAHSGRQLHTVVGAGSVHSGSFNSQTPTAAAAAEGPDASKPEEGVGSTDAAEAAATAGADEGSTGGAEGGTVAVAPKASAEDDDGGWEQVPADTGEFDAWQPPKQQQQQQHWWRPHKQHAAAGPGEQPELGPEAWNALAHVRQALQFLVFEDKEALSLEDLTEHVCPALNHQQQYRLCTTAWSDAQDATDDAVSGAGGVSGEVLEQMKHLYTLSSNGGLIVTFLLDEPSGPLPFVQPPPAAATTAAAVAAARCKPSAVVCWDDGRDYGVGLRPVPAVLVDEGCPAEVFEFLATDQHWPPGRHGS